jgi:hypothetical protein
LDAAAFAHPAARRLASTARRDGSRRRRSARSSRSTGLAAEAALGQEGRQFRRLARPARIRGREHHAGEAGVEREGAEPPALWRDAAVAVQRVEPDEERASLRQRGRWRRIEEGQAGRVGDAPLGAVEQQTREVAGQDLGPREGSSEPVAASSHNR